MGLKVFYHADQYYQKMPLLTKKSACAKLFSPDKSGYLSKTQKPLTCRQ